MQATQVAPPSTRLKRLYVALPTDEFRDLKAAADRETRTADQQATHIVRSWLRERGRGDEGEDDARAS